MSYLISIHNDGGEIVSTNYWQSDLAAGGKFFLSFNAGTVRLLVPPILIETLREMETGKTIVLTLGEHQRKEGAVELLFDDGSNAPFAILLDPVQLERRWPTADDGREVPFAVYTTTGKSLVRTCFLRRTRKLPYLKPWKGAGQ
jgi:hypothetical protein